MNSLTKIKSVKSNNLVTSYELQVTSKKCRKPLTVLRSRMTVLLFCSLFGLILSTANAQSGQCGANAYWQLNGNSLSITGSGDMYDWSWNFTPVTYPPWWDYKASINMVSIGNGITSIGSGAFYGFVNLPAITIPGSVTSIKTRAFEDCSSLSSVNIPNGVTQISSSTFKGCSSLTSINLPISVTSIGGGAFNGCGFSTFTVPNHVTHIGGHQNVVNAPTGGAFENCTNLILVTLSSSMTEINSRMFQGCTNLATVTISSSITNFNDLVGGRAFTGCTNLSFVKTFALIPPTSAWFPSNTYSGALLMPTGAFPLYATTSPWSNFFTKQEGGYLVFPVSSNIIGGYVNGNNLYPIGGKAIATVDAVAHEGYHFVNWTKDGEFVSSQNPYSFTVTEDVQLTANFEVNGFVEVTNITNLPTTATVGVPLEFTGTVVPSNATQQAIDYNITNAGTTGATLINNSIDISNDFATPASVSDWTLSSGVTWVNDPNYGTSLQFVTGDQYAIMPALPENIRNLDITITVMNGNYIYLYTSPDGINYTNQGLFANNTGVVTASKSMPTGTRYVKFVGFGTAYYKYLMSVAIIGDGDEYIFNATAPGTASLRATIENGLPGGFNYTKDFNITVVNDPTITTTTLPAGTTGTAYNQQLTATGTTPITWTLNSGNLPTNLSLSTAGVISGTPSTAGTFNFTVKATNSAGNDTKALSIVINAAATPPVITTTTLPSSCTGTTYSQQLTATGTTPITWTLQSGNLPNNITLSTSGLLSGTPNTAGTFNFTVKATNSAGNDTKALSIVINAPPVVTTSALAGGVTGTAYSQTLTATGSTPITWTVSSGNLPNNLSLSTSGVISGTPNTAGTFNFTVKAENSCGNNTKSLSIVITAPPVITTTTLPGGLIGTTYSAQLAASGTTPITWTLQSGNLPAGLTLSSAGVISGTPSTTGTSNFTVKATNSVGNDTKALSIVVTNSAVAPVITTTSLPNGSTGNAYSAQLEASGTAPITWTLASGTLPTGLTLSSAGVISGTPTTVGTSTFTVKATNSAGNNSKALSITITNSAIAPEITTTTLPDGVEETAYSQTLTATGTAPITWTLQNGNLPDGLTLSAEGVITGTPSAAGTSNFTVKAANSAGSDTKVLSITISPALAISENEISTIKVYPNPTSGELHIGYAICDNAICDIEIYDLMGRRVATVETLRATSLQSASPETTINVSHLPTGMYFLKIGNKTVKFVKE